MYLYRYTYITTPCSLYSLSSASNLLALHLSHNLITTLYSDLGGCYTLQHLDLTSNKLTYLPIEIGLLIHLECLLLSHNNLIDLPMELGACTKLTRLEVSNNKLGCKIGANKEKVGVNEKIGSTGLGLGLGNSIGCLPDTIGLIQSLK